MSRMVAEIFDEVKRAPEEKKIEVLRKYAQPKFPGLQRILEIAYHPLIAFNLPDGDPEFRSSEANAPIEMGHTNIHKESRNFYLYLKYNGVAINGSIPSSFKREMTFVRLLEALHPREAKLLLAAKSKDMAEFGISHDLASKVFRSIPAPVVVVETPKNEPSSSSIGSVGSLEELPKKKIPRVKKKTGRRRSVKRKKKLLVEVS